MLNRSKTRSGERRQKRLSRTYPVLSAAIILLSAVGASAQEPITITLQQAVQLGLERNPTLLTAENSAELSSLTVRQQRMQLLPSLNVTSSTQQSYGRTFNQDEGRILNQTTQSFNGGLSSNVVLFNGLSNLASLRQARLTESANLSDLDRARQTVVFTVLSGYLTIVEQQEQLRVQQENLASVEALEAQIQAYVDAGVRPISDLYQQQAVTANTRLQLVQARRSVELARMSLLRILQLDPSEEYIFPAPELTEPSVIDGGVDLDQLTQQALSRRPDVAAAEARVMAADQAVRIASGSRWPALSLTLGYNSGYNSSSETDFFDQLDERRGGSVGVNLSLPIFDRASSSIAKQRGRIQAENARVSLEGARQGVAIEVRTAFLDLEYAEEQLRQAEAQLRAAELGLEASQERYNVGATTFVELSQARAAQVRAASDLVTARHGLVFQSRLVDYYLGNLTIANADDL